MDFCTTVQQEETGTFITSFQEVVEEVEAVLWANSICRCSASEQELGGGKAGKTESSTERRLARRISGIEMHFTR